MSKIEETQEINKEKVQKTIAKAAQTVKEPVVYVGPQIGKLKKNTTYIKGVPKEAEELIKEKPAIKKLFVKVSEVAEAKKQLEKENSALSIIYRKIAE